jgi:hypothetical protein
VNFFISTGVETVSRSGVLGRWVNAKTSSCGT